LPSEFYARRVESREAVEVRRADEEGVSRQYEQHESPCAARTSLQKIVET
jgi:hypothetical protein